MSSKYQVQKWRVDISIADKIKKGLTPQVVLEDMPLKSRYDI
jgi:hypothetical protein